MKLYQKHILIGYFELVQSVFKFLVVAIVLSQLACSKNRRTDTPSGPLAVEEDDDTTNPVQESEKCDTLLTQENFSDGTYIIREPGTYCLSEDISFNPNNAAYLRLKLQNESITAYDSGFPLRSQFGAGPGQYDPAAFGLGFFAAIAVSASDVVIDLKGKTIEQSKEHALLQRFFSVIETADRPFISGQGPFDFGANVGSAENLTIKNGIIGRSAHHGIHGNRTKNLTVTDVKFEDFEVAAIAMNGVDGLVLKNLSAYSSQNVPVLGQYSTAQFIKPYLDYLVLSGSTIQLNGLSAFQIQQSLKSSINNVHADLVVNNLKEIDRNAHPSEWALFHNAAGVVDGNAYGILINGVGVAVNGFPFVNSTDSPSTNVSIDNVKIYGLRANVREIVSVAADATEGKAANDPVGSLFQLLAKGPDGSALTLSEATDQGSYIGNAVTNAQAIVAKATHASVFPSSLDTSRNSISPALIQWVESRHPLRDYLSLNPGPHGTGYVCNGDQMFHVNKGVIGFKLDGSDGVSLTNSEIDGATNIGKLGSSLCGDYVKSHPKATLEGYGGSIVRGVSISGSKNVSLKNLKMERLASSNGSAVGVDILTDSDSVSLMTVQVDGLMASQSPESLAMAVQKAVGLRIGADATNITSDGFCAKGMTARGNLVEMISDKSGLAQFERSCLP